MSVTPVFALSEAPPAVNKECAKTEKKIKKRFKRTKFYSWNRKNDEAVWNLILHRKKKKYNIVCIVYGQVMDRKKNGMTASGYISYKRVKKARKGDWITTYLIYSRGNNYCDDIIARYDVIMR